MEKRCLILTGTIKPNTVFTEHNNPETRAREYLEGLNFYSETLDDKIYFIENSPHDFSKDKDFQELFKEKDIELIKFPVSTEAHRGKGHLEFEMIDQVVKKLSGQYHSFIKITGRYKYINIEKMTDFECEGLVIDTFRKTKVTLSSIFYSTFDFYREHLMGLYREVDDSQGIWIEKVLYNKFKNKKFRSQVKLFPVEPLLIRIAGSRGIYHDTTKNILKNRVRNLERPALGRLSLNQIYI